MTMNPTDAKDLAALKKRYAKASKKKNAARSSTNVSKRHKVIADMRFVAG
jgi:hypothetical protein